MNYRLYSFVANLYLSPLQCGLQTAHVVSEISRMPGQDGYMPSMPYMKWADNDKTIIICGAVNHKGVTSCFETLQPLASTLGLPCAIFHEDEQSMNSMATACGVVVPEKYWNVVFEDAMETGGTSRYVHSVVTDGVVTSIHAYNEFSPEFEFIKHIKGYRLA